MGLIRSDTVSIDGRMFEFALAGSGVLPIVLVNGSGGHLDSWYRMFDKLAEIGPVLAYNRPGIGKSSHSSDPQTVSACANDLVAVLRGARLSPPWIIVGHSFGGLIANYLARVEPVRVGGLILLDATAPADIDAASHASQSSGWFARLAAVFAPKVQHSEICNSSASVAEIERAGPFPSIPLMVVTGAKSATGWTVPKAFREMRLRHQQDLTKLSPMGRQIVAIKSGHFPQMNEPELVVQAIVNIRIEVQGAAQR